MRPGQGAGAHRGHLARQSLGADLNAKKTVDAKARFEAAAAKVREATKANPGIKVLVGSGSADLFYVSTPETSADLKYFKQLGVEFVTPEKLDEGGFFESLSWENAGKYKADVVLLDNRTGTLQPDTLKEKATWAELPAVKARDHPARDRADLLVRQVRPAPGRPREVHPERQEGQLHLGARDPGALQAVPTPGGPLRSPPPHPTPRRSRTSGSSAQIVRQRRLGHSFLRVTFGGQSSRASVRGGFDQSLSLFPAPVRSGAHRAPVHGRGHLVRRLARNAGGGAAGDALLHGARAAPYHRRRTRSTSTSSCTDTGPASRWAGQAVAGRRILAIGPAVAENKSVRFQPPADTDAICVDVRGTTALPAAARDPYWLPAGTGVRAWFQVPHQGMTGSTCSTTCSPGHHLDRAGAAMAGSGTSRCSTCRRGRQPLLLLPRTPGWRARPQRFAPCAATSCRNDPSTAAPSASRVTGDWRERGAAARRGIRGQGSERGPDVRAVVSFLTPQRT
ncbi:hypothetical protein SAVIM40S_02976 [Streptomyces avidinii]